MSLTSSHFSNTTLLFPLKPLHATLDNWISKVWRNVIKMELYSEAAICPANPKQTRVLLEVLFSDSQMALTVTLPFKGSTTLLVRLCECHCLDPVCQKDLLLWVYVGHRDGLQLSTIIWS